MGVIGQWFSSCNGFSVYNALSKEFLFTLLTDVSDNVPDSSDTFVFAERYSTTELNVVFFFFSNTITTIIFHIGYF